MVQPKTYWHQRADQMKNLLRKLKWKWSGHHVWRQAPLKTRPLWWMSLSTAAAPSLFKKWLSEEALHQQRTLSWEATTTRIPTHSCLMKINDIYSEPQPLGFTTPAPHLCGCTSYSYLYSSYPPYHVVHVVYMYYTVNPSILVNKGVSRGISLQVTCPCYQGGPRYRSLALSSVNPTTPVVNTTTIR